MEIHDFSLVTGRLLDGLAKEGGVWDWGEIEVEIFDIFRQKFIGFFGFGGWFGEIDTHVGGNGVNIVQKVQRGHHCKLLSKKGEEIFFFILYFEFFFVFPQSFVV